ncbi:MAG TPA: zinc-binding dehydrogenase [Acidimicrobiales bacterium]
MTSSAGVTSPRTTTATVLSSPGGPLEPTEVPVPDLGPGELLVEVEAATVCGTDVHLWRGEVTTGRPLELPAILGHEGCGRVVACGAPVVVGDGGGAGGPAAVGDRIVWTHAPCGRCRACAVWRRPAACPQRLTYGRWPLRTPPHLTGTFARHCVVVAGAGRVRVPPAVPAPVAAAASCAVRTAAHAIERACRPGPVGSAAGVPGSVAGAPGSAVGSAEAAAGLAGRSVLVQGAGPLGLAVAAWARHLAAERVVAVDARPERRALASRFGATTAVPPGAAAEAVGAGGADVAFECSGAAAAPAEGVRALRPGARYVLVGQVGGSGAVPAAEVVRRQLTVDGILSAEPRHYASALAFVAATLSTYPWHALVADRFPLARATEALTAAATGAALKPVVAPDP